MSEIDGKPVTVSLPWSLKKREDAHDGQRAKQSQKQWAKGVVTRVPLELSIEEIKEETGAIWAHRITKRGSEGFMPTMAVIIAYENELPKSVNIGFERHRVSVYIPNPVRCGKCQRYGHKANHCRAEKPRCPRCAQAHQYGSCTVPAEQLRCANCGETHSSAYKGCKKYKEVSSALKLVATEKMSYRDALKQTKVTSSAAGKPVTNAPLQAPIKPRDETGELSTVERKSVETQTDAPQQDVWQTDEPSDSSMSREQMATLLTTTAGALLWLIESLQSLQPNQAQSDIARQLTAALQVIGTTTQQRAQQPPAAAVETEQPCTAVVAIN